MEAQVLDSMDIERERGITIKAQTVRLQYRTRRQRRVYNLNLIDTPGASTSATRSAARCRPARALLVVDASQGVEAQTVANCYPRSTSASRWCRC